MEGHKSHATVKIQNFCAIAKIDIFMLPPHVTHLLQPLDLKVFSPYKNVHTVNNAADLGAMELDQVLFLGNFAGVRKQTTKKNTVLSAWRDAGIRPWCPDKVLDKIPPRILPNEPETLLGRLQTPSPDLNIPLDPQTPRTLQQFKVSAENILNREEEISPDTERFIRGAVVRLDMLEKMKDDMGKVLALAEHTSRRKKNGGNRQASSGGAVYMGTAHLIDKKLHSEVAERAAR